MIIFLLLIVTRALHLNVGCYPEINNCTSLLVYFRLDYTIVSSSYLHFTLPFQLYKETLTLSSLDDTTYPITILNGDQYYKVAVGIPPLLWLKAYISLTTVEITQSGVGQFQMQVLSSNSPNSVELESSPLVPLYYKLITKIYTTTPKVKLAAVVPVTQGTSCTGSDWSKPIQMLRVHQLNSFTFTLSADVTNDNLNVQASLNAVPTGLIFLKSCFLSGVELLRQSSDCQLTQSSGVLQFLIRSEYPVLLLKATSYTIEFFVTHRGTVITPATFLLQIQREGVIIDSCIPTYNVAVDSTVLTVETIKDVVLHISTPNQAIPTTMSLIFRPRAVEYDTQIRIELGFMQHTNPKCSVSIFTDEWIPSNMFSQILISLTNILLITNPLTVNGGSYLYALNCTGFRVVPNNAQLQIIYEDLKGAVISYYSIDQPLRIPTTTQSQQKIKLHSKRFNNPLSSTVITFLITPTTPIVRVLIEFAAEYTYEQISCSMNGVSARCESDDMNDNRIIVFAQFYHKQKVSQPFNVTIYGMINPLDLPYGSIIWVGLDDDYQIDPLFNGNENILNGIIQWESFDDYIIGEQPNQLQLEPFKFSTQQSRTSNSYLLVNISVPYSSIKESNKLYLRISEQYMVTQLKCTLFKQGDVQLNNYIKDKCLQEQQYIKMELKTDTGNSRFSAQYTLNISTFRTQDVDNSLLYKYFQPPFEMFLTDKLDNVLLLAKHQAIKIPSMSTTKLQLFWYNVGQDGQYTKLMPVEGSDETPYFEVYNGYFGPQQLFLGYADITARFNVTIYVHFPNNPELVIYAKNSQISRVSYTNEPLMMPKYVLTSLTDDTGYELQSDNVLTIKPGDSGIWVQIAAKTLANYLIPFQVNITLEYPTANSWNPISYYNPYAELPIAWLQVIEPTCEYTFEYSQYTLPINGSTLPIIMDITQCIPLVDTPIIFPTLPNGLVIDHIQTSISMKRIEELRRTSPTNPTIGYIFRVMTTSNTVNGITSIIKVLNKLVSIAVTGTILDPPKPLDLIGVYNEASNIVSIKVGCSQSSEIELIIAQDEVSDATFKSFTSDITKPYTGNMSLFRLTPQFTNGQYQLSVELSNKQMIANLYNNYVADQIMKYNTTILQEVNQQNLKDTIYKVLMRQFNRIMLAKWNLLKKSYQIQLQRNIIRINYIDQPQNILVKNLRYDTRYSFGYYCKNQMGYMSNFTQNLLYTNNMTIKNNRTMGQLLNITFKSQPTQQQLNNVLCATAIYFQLNYYQVLSKQCHQCDFGNTTYPKINSTQYKQLLNNYVPYANMTSAEQQRYTEGLFIHSIYLNSYDQSSGLSNNISQIVTTKAGNVTLDTIKAILNITDDLHLQYLLEGVTYTELKPIKRTQEELATQLVLLEVKPKNQNLEVTIKANLPILAFVGLHLIQPIYEGQLKHPPGILLRRGLLGTMDQISEGTQYAELQVDSNTTLIFKELIEDGKYILYWSSSDLLNDCLSKQYSETGMQILQFKSALESSSMRLLIYILILNGLI